MQSDYLLCCDWGSSNFRLYLVNARTQKIQARHADGHGIKALHQQWKAGGDPDRIGFFRLFLHHQISLLAASSGQDLIDIPVSISGMASSSIGCVEVDYTSVPISLADPQLRSHHLPATAQWPNPLHFFGGLRTESDVMRGEEVQMIGLLAMLPEENCLCLLPGTHSKHLFIHEGHLTDFQTFMTGELFEILVSHSMLKESLASPADFEGVMEAFEAGVHQSAKSSLPNALFQVRARALLHHSSKEVNYAYLSGLLIGHELQAVKEYQGPVFIAGQGKLGKLYSRASACIDSAGNCREISGEALEQALVLGHLKLMGRA